jgi:hypothetical protein
MSFVRSISPDQLIGGLALEFFILQNKNRAQKATLMSRAERHKQPKIKLGRQQICGRLWH